MATATVYTIDENGEVVEQFDCDYNLAIATYWSQKCKKGTYHCARKGVKIPYKFKKKLLKNIKPSSHQAQE